MLSCISWLGKFCKKEIVNLYVLLLKFWGSNLSNWMMNCPMWDLWKTFLLLSRISFQHTCTCMCIEFLGSLFLQMSLSFWSFITKEAYNSIDDQTRIRDNERIFFYELDRITKIILNHKIEKIMSDHIYEFDEITEKITFNIVGVAHFRSIRF